jgi:hypothetical protein
LIKEVIATCANECGFCKFGTNRREELSSSAPIQDGCLIRDGKVYKIE